MRGALTNYEGRGESRAVAMDGIPGDLGRGDEIKPRPKNHDFVTAEVYIIREN